MISGSSKQPLKSCKIRRKRSQNTEIQRKGTISHVLPQVKDGRGVGTLNISCTEPCSPSRAEGITVISDCFGFIHKDVIEIMRLYKQLQPPRRWREFTGNSEVFHNGAMLKNAEPAVRPAVLLSHCLCLIKCFCGFCLKENADLLN